MIHHSDSSTPTIIIHDKLHFRIVALYLAASDSDKIVINMIHDALSQHKHNQSITSMIKMEDLCDVINQETVIAVY